MLKSYNRRSVVLIQSGKKFLWKKKRLVTITSSSLGLQTRPDLVPGFAEASLHPWEMDSAVRLRDTLASFRGGRVVVGVPLGPYRCPPAPYEAQWMLDGYFRQQGIRERVEIEYFTRGRSRRRSSRQSSGWMQKATQHQAKLRIRGPGIDPEKKFKGCTITIIL